MKDTWLYSYATHRPIAFSTDGEWYFKADAPTTPLGYMVKEWMFSPSGQPMGWFDDGSMFDVEGRPLYYAA